MYKSSSRCADGLNAFAGVFRFIVPFGLQERGGPALEIMILAVLVIAAAYCVFILPAQWVKVERIRHPIGAGCRIVQISDLHAERNWVSPERLRALAEREKPDYIFLTGDYTQRVRYLDLVDRYLEEILNIGVPVYAVLGNHDYRLKEDVDQLIERFRRRGIPLLRNEWVRLKEFTLVGIDDFVSRQARVKWAFEGVGEDEKVVVITHDPNVTLRIFRNYDYLMCGHLHGKQFRIPFLYFFKRKGPLARKGIYKGLHRNRWGVFYISKGLGQSHVNARFGVRSEITVHEL